MSEFKRPYYFNLNKDGDSAVVRILHTNPGTIEIEDLYTIELDGKKKRLKVNGDDTILRNKGMKSYSRMFLHVWDYTDEAGNYEKVWDRTTTIKPQIEKLFQSWNPLHSAVVKITRVGNEFPKYEIEPQNPMNYKQVDEKLIDAEISKYFHLTRKTEDIQVFLNTGKFPDKKPYLSKEEYAKQQSTNVGVKEESKVKDVNTSSVTEDDDDSLPF